MREMETVTFEVLLSARELMAQCEEHESTKPSQGAATRAGKRQRSSCNSSMRTGAMRTTHPVITKSWHKCHKRLAAVLKSQLNETPDKLQAWTCTPAPGRTSDKQKGFAKAHSAPACCAKHVCFLKEKNNKKTNTTTLSGEGIMKLQRAPGSYMVRVSVPRAGSRTNAF